MVWVFSSSSDSSVLIWSHRTASEEIQIRLNHMQFQIITFRWTRSVFDFMTAFINLKYIYRNTNSKRKCCESAKKNSDFTALPPIIIIKLTNGQENKAFHAMTVSKIMRICRFNYSTENKGVKMSSKTSDIRWKDWRGTFYCTVSNILLLVMEDFKAFDMIMNF